MRHLADRKMCNAIRPSCIDAVIEAILYELHLTAWGGSSF